MLYKITDGTLSFGEREVLSHINFEIKGNEKIAIVGANGAGKTTLLRLIAGELELDRDDRRMEPGIWKSRSLTVAMLSQALVLPDTTVRLFRDLPDTGIQYAGSDAAYEDNYTSGSLPGLHASDFDRMFTSLGFLSDDLDKKLSDFSGGQQTKIRLIKLLLSKPDILLLDEPTNHLDISSMEWLEEYLCSYDGAVIMVSHDRFFLDRTVNIVYELSHGRLTRYSGNYTAYREQKVKNIAAQKRAYTSQQEEIARQQELIERFKHKSKKAAFARSRATILRRMERLEPPEEDDAHIFTGELSLPTPGSKWPLITDHLQIGYDHVLLDITLRAHRGQKIAIIGSNGIGKSTFLKTIAGEIAPLKGKFSLGNRDLPGYFDQHTASITSEQTVLEYFRGYFPNMTEQELRKTLGAYLFSGQDAAKSINSLSGGEKSRLILAKLLTLRPHLLLLDEPTNHMDIHVKETLESAFGAYAGTIIFVSHDRYFISHVADTIWVFDENGVTCDPFGYEHYLEKRRTAGSPAAMLRAEDAALRESFAAVPRREHHETPPPDDDEAYRNWRLSIASEELDSARKRVEDLAAQYEAARLAAWSANEPHQEEPADPKLPAQSSTCTGDCLYAATLNLQAIHSQLDAAYDDWTAACLDWFEIFDAP
ncbi:MAG: ATP-binding cassette domain-containing protein [Clostridiales bacterium]|nr:ATP-binding cassette domain-containing protein [Clostridiales bacterium]